MSSHLNGPYYYVKYYHLVIAFTYGLAESDHIKRILLCISFSCMFLIPVYYQIKIPVIVIFFVL